VSAAAEEPDVGRGTLALTTAIVMGIITSVTMIGPLLVDIARDLRLPLGRVSVLAVVSAVPQALSSPFAGLLADRFGRRPMIVLSLASSGLLALIASVAPSFAMLVVIRLVAGLVNSVAPTSTLAALGDLCRGQRLSRAMGWFNVGFSFAAIAGVPAMSALGGAFGWRWAFATMGVLLLLLSLSVLRWFPDARPRVTTASVPATYRALFRVRGLWSLMSANLIERSMFMMVTIYLPVFLMLAYTLSAIAVAPALSIVAVGAIAGNVVGSWLGDRVPRPAVFVAAQLIAGLLGLALFGAQLLLPLAVALAALLAFANSASRPGILAYTAEFSPAHRGALFGLLALTNQTGVIIGTAIGAAVLAHGNYGAFAVVTFVQGVLAAALAWPLVLKRPSPMT
jgi:predicted MFS family arabinose efflux permease